MKSEKERRVPTRDRAIVHLLGLAVVATIVFAALESYTRSDLFVAPKDAFYGIASCIALAWAVISFVDLRNLAKSKSSNS